VLISPEPDQEGNKLQRQKILILIYPIYNHNWRSIGTIYIYTYIYIYIHIQYITRLASNEIFSPSNKIHREVGRAKDLPAPLYSYRPPDDGRSNERPKHVQDNDKRTSSVRVLCSCGSDC
jgi:hypothetical protein